MKILHIIPSLGVSGGGPSQSVFYTVKGLQQQGADATVVTCQPRAGDSFVADAPFIAKLPASISSFAYSPQLKKFMASHRFDIYHAQGIWQYPAYITARFARQTGKPYIITPRGMLYPQALQISAWKKRIALAMFQRRDLQRAACVQATCVQELQHIRAFGITAPVAVIPNGLNINSTLLPRNTPGTKRRFGFVGRLHAIKNVDTLLKSWQKLGELTKNAELVIVGSGDTAYETLLRQFVAEHHIDNISFAGFLTGEALAQTIQTLDFLVLPSHSENFGMVVPEALTLGVPVIASKGTPWEELNTRQCGWWINNDADTLAATIETALHTPEEARRVMGQNGRALVIENYSIESTAKKLIQLYSWILNHTPKPEFVYI